MNTSQSSSKLTIVFVVSAAVLMVGGLVAKMTAPEPELREASGEQPVSLRNALVEARSFRRVTEVAGLLEARQEVELFAEGNGKVVSVGAEELDRVDQAQVLLQIDPLLAKIEVDEAGAMLARARSELKLAFANLERQKSLRGNSVASEAAYDSAVNGEQIATSAVAQARARVARAKDSLAKMTLAAPFAGELRLFPVMVGEYIRAGERVGELLDVSKLRVEIGLSDREVVAVNVGARARLVVEARPGEIFEGTIRRVGGAPDPGSRKFPVQVEVDNREGRLLPGMVARVQLDLGAPGMRIAIPREAVVTEFGMGSVYVLQKDEQGDWRSTARRVEVREIPFNPVEVEVVAGLSLGERVALSGLHQLGEGVLVALRKAEDAPAAEQVVRRTALDAVSSEPTRPSQSAESGEGG